MPSKALTHDRIVDGPRRDLPGAGERALEGPVAVSVGDLKSVAKLFVFIC
jgi:hypothetical protein